MADLYRKLSTNDVMVFDSANRVLYIIPACEVENQSSISVDEAARLVERGKAKQLSKDELKTLQEALSVVVLLEAA
jgi:hypothetical protein